MPRSSVGMTDFDGTYEFDIDGYLISTYPNITKPARRAICDWARVRIDKMQIEDMVDQVVLEYALDQQGWTPEEEDDD
jgi:hypothetical protein